MRIGIDVMACDTSLHVVQEAIQATLQSPRDSFVIIGSHETLKQIHKDTQHLSKSLEWLVAQEEVKLDDPPAKAARTKKNSSLVLGMSLLREKKIDAFLSGGNTGALAATALLHLKKLPGISRPALLSTFPTARDFIVVLDVGASVRLRPEHFVELAHMGAAYFSAFFLKKAPARVGLLNIGSEKSKGTDPLQQAFHLLQKTSAHAFQFIGNIEPRNAFSGQVDVLLCDGFTGNIFLKTAEGAASLILHRLQQAFEGAELQDKKHILHSIQKTFDYAEYPGAFLCGMDGVVVKCHGGSGERAWTNAIKGAMQLVLHDAVEKIRDCLQ